MSLARVLVALALLTVSAAALAPAAEAQSPGACVQINTFVRGMAHSCPLGYPQFPKPASCYVNYYQNLVGERAGFIVWVC